MKFGLRVCARGMRSPARSRVTDELGERQSGTVRTAERDKRKHEDVKLSRKMPAEGRARQPPCGKQPLCCDMGPGFRRTFAATTAFRRKDARPVRQPPRCRVCVSQQPCPCPACHRRNQAGHHHRRTAVPDSHTQRTPTLAKLSQGRSQGAVSPSGVSPGR